VRSTSMGQTHAQWAWQFGQRLLSKFSYHARLGHANFGCQSSWQVTTVPAKAVKLIVLLCSLSIGNSDTYYI